MSVTGIASSILSALGNSHNHQSRFQQIGSEFQQLAQYLQSGNLSQAQSDFTTLSQNLPGLNHGSSTTATAATAATTAPNTNPIAQVFTQLGQDLQSGNLQGAQQDFTSLQQDLEQNVGQVGRHHHHHAENSQQSTSSQVTNSMDQAFAQLSQNLQGGNLSGAQSAFSTLLSDLQQIGGVVTSGGSSTAAFASTGLNVSA